MRKLLVLFFISINLVHDNRGIIEKPMVVIIPSYNNAAWYKSNLESILSQHYHNYRVIYIDDCSSDNTADLVEQYACELGKADLVTLIRNQQRQGALANLYYAIHQCHDNEIIVTVDGDDWLAHHHVLEKLNEVYSRKDIWMSHGSFTETNWAGNYWSIDIPKKIAKKNLFRTFRCPSHLRTFYARLFKKIKTEDLMHEGEFFKMSWDQAMMFPMAEMAGKHRAFIKDILYVYNTRTRLNDNKVNPALQRKLEAIIRNKECYEKLREL